MRESGTKDRAGGAGRKARQAAALRENLRKRKTQARDRAEGAEADSGPQAPPRDPPPQNPPPQNPPPAKPARTE